MGHFGTKNGSKIGHKCVSPKVNPFLTEFSPFNHMYGPLCALRTYLRAVWWSHLELGEGCRLEDMYIYIYIYIYILLHHLGFYGVQKSQSQLQAKILPFLSNHTIKSLFSGVCHPPSPQTRNFPAPRSTMQACFHLKSAVCEKYDIHHLVANSSFCIAQTMHVTFWGKNTVVGNGGSKTLYKMLQNSAKHVLLCPATSK